MTSEYPLVTIITPVYNGAKYIEELILSVKAQDYPCIEHVIIDDGSNDGGATVAILKRYSHLRWWSRENRGRYATMNEGLEAARGEVVCFIHADDVMSTGAIRISIQYLQENANLDGVYGNYEYINDKGNLIHLLRPFREMPTKLYPYSLHISHSSFYLRRTSLIENQLFFDAALQYVGDYDWIVRILRGPLQIGRIPQKLSLFRIHKDQTTNVHFSAMKYESLLVQKRLNISTLWASLFRKVLFLAKIINTIQESGTKQVLSDLQARLSHSSRKDRMLL